MLDFSYANSSKVFASCQTATVSEQEVREPEPHRI